MKARRRTGALVLTGTLCLGLAVAWGPASADELSDLYDQEEQLRAQQDAVAETLEQLGTELEQTEVRLIEAYAELRGIEARIVVAEQELVLAEERHAERAREAQIVADRLSVAEDEADSIATKIAEDAERADGLRSAIGQMARDAYKGGLATSSLAAVLDATSTEDFVTQSALRDAALRTQTLALHDLEQLSGANRNREARLAAVRDEIVVLKVEADEKLAAAEEARQEAEARRTGLETLRLDQQEKTLLIESERENQLAKQQEFEQQQAQLATDIADVIRLQDEEIERRRNQGDDTDVGVGTGVLGNPTTLNPYYVTSHYGMRVHPIFGYERLHAGTDFRAYCGDPIIASDAGTVVWTMMRGGFGNQVLIDHGRHDGVSIMTSYNHLSGYAVSAGAVVSKGQLVGYSGNTGSSTACHLHFEVYLDGKTVNPLTMM